ncbi:hypothetical protein V1460_15255 [Streptomyces sp. SCSIO 30461]
MAKGLPARHEVRGAYALKTWRLLRKPRCGTTRVTHVVRVVLALAPT